MGFHGLEIEIQFMHRNRDVSFTTPCISMQLTDWVMYTTDSRDANASKKFISLILFHDKLREITTSREILLDIEWECTWVHCHWEIPFGTILYISSTTWCEHQIIMSPITLLFIIIRGRFLHVDIAGWQHLKWIQYFN